MKKQLLVSLCSLPLFSCTSIHSFHQQDIFGITDSRYIVETLASDDMKGRGVYSDDIYRASAFIEKEFERLELGYLWHLPSYKHIFVKNGYQMNNVIGVIEGKTKPNEWVIFSAHYDHLGLLGTKNNHGGMSYDKEVVVKKGREANGSIHHDLLSQNVEAVISQDIIFNGANDNASGVAGLIQLARYFKQKDDNERTIVFMAFTGEELGLFGSNEMVDEMSYDDLDKVVAVINIDMIGGQTKWGANTAFITGYNKTNLGEILNKNVEDTGFKFYADPYPDEQLFYRSDNRSFARWGVPAHTVMVVDLDKDKRYHTVEDEADSINYNSIQSTITAIAKGVETIINGEDTPTRVENFW